MMSVDLMQEELEMASRVLAKWIKAFNDEGFMGPVDPNRPSVTSEESLAEFCDELVFVSNSLEKISEITTQRQMIDNSSY